MKKFKLSFVFYANKLMHHESIKEFWELLSLVLPDYKARKEWLKIVFGISLMYDNINCKIKQIRI